VAGAVVVAVTTAVAAGGAVRRGLRAVEPSFLPPALHPRRLVAVGLRPVARLGHGWRERVLADVVVRLDAALPVVVDVAMRRLQPTELVRRYVDLDELVGTVDLDAVAKRLDVQAVVARVDLDEAAARLDVEAILDRIDLTDTVLNRVDLEAVVTAVLAEVDVAALVEQALDELDLPEIIRESTGTMASETVRSVRMRGVGADEAVNRVVDRLLLRRGRPATGGPATGGPATGGTVPG
jgi:hypothetical protein